MPRKNFGDNPQDFVGMDSQSWMPLEKLYTVKEAAEILRFHPVTLREYCFKGKIRAYKPGRRWRIPESSLKKFLEGSRS